MAGKKDTGKIGWIDLSVENASQVKDFYVEVAGWDSAAVSLGDYDDYCMMPPAIDGNPQDPIAGICHKRGENSGMPSQWLMYINVENLDESLANCRRLGGKTVTPTRNMGSYGKMCVISDPAGAIVALIEPPE